MIGEDVVAARSDAGRGMRRALGTYLQEAIQILQLDTRAISRVAKDEEALLPALLFFAIGGLANGAGHFSFTGMVFGPILATLMSFVFVGLLSIIARLFGSTASFLELYRPLGVAAPLHWVQAVPLIGSFLGALALFYFAVIAGLTIETTGHLPRAKAIAVVVLLAGIVLFLVLVFLAMYGSYFLIRALFT